MAKIKVLIVDDSAVIRLLLSEIFAQDDELEVVSTAADPYEARDKIKRYNPDVITLDIEMPKMDGIKFLANLMRLRPTAVVMVSTLTRRGADMTLKALELGAFDFIYKPAHDIKYGLTRYADSLIAKTKAAARCFRATNPVKTELPRPALSGQQFRYDLIAIGASTGGTEAIKHLLMSLPANLPPIVIVQHIPELFATSFANRLNRQLSIQVTEVRGATELMAGQAYLAPGDDHLLVARHKTKLIATIEKSAPVNRHRPSVDVLFNSSTTALAGRCVGILLTGMGEDGARGLKSMRQQGGLTLVQDEASSIVWGMPGTAVSLNAVDKILPLNEIAGYLTKSIV